MKSLALRRHHEARVKDRARRHIASWGISPAHFPNPERAVGIHAHSPKGCNRQCCANPRKVWEGVTLPERRFALSAVEQSDQ